MEHEGFRMALRQMFVHATDMYRTRSPRALKSTSMEGALQTLDSSSPGNAMYRAAPSSNKWWNRNENNTIPSTTWNFLHLFTRGDCNSSHRVRSVFQANAEYHHPQGISQLLHIWSWIIPNEGMVCQSSFNLRSRILYQTTWRISTIFCCICASTASGSLTSHFPKADSITSGSLTRLLNFTLHIRPNSSGDAPSSANFRHLICKAIWKEKSLLRTRRSHFRASLLSVRCSSPSGETTNLHVAIEEILLPPYNHIQQTSSIALSSSNILRNAISSQMNQAPILHIAEGFPKTAAL